MTEIVEIALFTDDVAVAKAFYARLVGTRSGRRVAGRRDLLGGGVKLLVHERGRRARGRAAERGSLRVRRFGRRRGCAALAAEGLALLVEPRDYDWGRSAYLRDPDGRLVELSQT